VPEPLELEKMVLKACAGLGVVKRRQVS